jgi:ABC-type Fe3+/spermidine/putrescine transport system ATPase subunit
MLEIKNIEKTYEGKPLLKKVSFTIEEDETVCLLGSSGSGKSTLLRIIAGLEEAEGGQVFWEGEDLADIPAHKRHFGLMFQDYALFPHKNVSENIAFGLKMQNRPANEIDQRVKDALETINMVDFKDRKVTELSGGEQQRVALARALAPEPRLLMLDEPLGALDRTLREQLSRELRRILRDTRVPAIYVTHDQEEAFSIADRLLLLHDGKILQSGKPHEIFQHPKNVWVAKFFGLGNLIEGKVKGRSPLTVETPLGRIEANCNVDPPQIGEDASLLFRPNQACRDESECGNTFSGEVIDQLFQGDDYHVMLKINHAVPLFNIRLKEPVQIGDRLNIAYHSEDILCLSNGEEKS